MLGGQQHVSPWALQSQDCPCSLLENIVASTSIR
jgi:hypothetical protein